jgi:hypothetical protein
VSQVPIPAMDTASNAAETSGSDVDESGQFYRDAAVSIRPAQEEIALRAYELFLRRGSRVGSETEDWLQAEKELIAEYNSRK